MEDQIELGRILLVDDDQDILDIVSYNLKKEGFEITTANNGKIGIELAKTFKPDLIILDVMMPEIDGIEACSAIRALPNMGKTIIAFLTARGEDYSQIAGFNAGADDYITKPIKPQVLISRVKALLRRVQNNDHEVVKQTDSPGLSIDLEKYLVHNNGLALTLPKKEFELLALLFTNPGKVFTRESIMERVWGNEVVVGDRTIDVHIRKIREKLGDSIIKTIKGVGYKLEI
jgi:two-component system alkaline phosphatase synthesis response regulator PhoP